MITPIYEHLEVRWVLAAFSYDVERIAEPELRNAYEIKAADIDNDGLVDLVVGADEPIWYRNEGNGIFTPSAVALSRHETYWQVTDIVVEDVDTDGDVDVLLAYADRISIAVNSGNGNFAEHILHVFEDDRAFDISRITRTMVQRGDLDGDGRWELVVGQNHDLETSDGIRHDAEVFLLRQSEDGGFSERTDLLQVSERVDFSFSRASILSDLSLADLDANGRLDVLVNSRLQTSWLQNRESGFEERVLFQAVGETPSAVPVDMDADGETEVAVSADSWFEIDSEGNHHRIGTANSGPLEQAWILDLDGDSVDELVARTHAAVITPTQSWEFENVLHAAFGDLDNDGDLDLAVISDADGELDFWFDGDGGVQMLLNDGHGDFQERLVVENEAELDVTSRPDPWIGFGRVLTVGDFTNDGRDDVITSPWSSEELSLTLHVAVGDDVFADPVDITVSQTSGCIAQTLPGDFNGDGYLDLFVNSHSRLWLIEHAGFDSPNPFGEPIEIVPENPTWFPASLMTFDADLDGDLDVVAANADWIENLGNREFTLHGEQFRPERSVPEGASPQLAYEDVTGDGKMNWSSRYLAM